MKYIFLLVFVIGVTSVNGQQVYVSSDSSLWRIPNKIPLGTMDTIKVRLLSLDTCYLWSILHTRNAYRVVERVRDLYYYWGGDSWKFIMWLDEKKTPLSKCIEVWQEK